MHLGSASKGVGLMRKLLLAFATALLIPGMLGAATLGAYFETPSRMADSPAPFSFFDVYPPMIGPHPDSGEIRGTFAPENELFPIVGLTSIICPELVGTQEESWGAIESLYR